MADYDLGTAKGRIIIDADGVGAGVSQANQSLGKLGQGSGFNASQFGAAMTLGVTAPILAVGGAALKTAVDFETAFAGVEKTVDGTEEQLATLRQGIIDMSKEIPASTTEIAAVAEAAGQLGVATEDVLDFTRVMIDLGNATNLTSDEAATSIARIQNIMGSGVDTVDEFGATLVALGNNSATTEAEILELANRLAGIAAQSGITEDAMLAIAATMSSVGVAAESGGTSITKTVKDFDSWSRSIQSATEAGEELKGTDAVFADLIGNMDEFAQSTGDQQLLTFITRLQEFEAEGGNVIALLEELEITEIRQSDALLKLVGSGDLLSESLALGADAWAENTALTEETGKRYETTASQMEIAKNNAQDILRILGEALIPVLRDGTQALIPVAQAVGGMASAFGALPEPIRKLVAGFALLLAAIGPVFFVGAKVVKTVQTIGTAFKALGLVMALNPFVLIVLAIIALIAAFVILYKRSEKFRNFIDNLGKNIAKVWGAVVSFFKKLPKEFEKIWKKITKAFEKAAEAVVGAFNTVIDFFSDLPGVIADFVGDVIDEVVGFGAMILGAMTDWLKQLPGRITSGLSAALDAFVGFLTKLPERFAFFLGLVIGTYIRFQIDLWTKIIETGVGVITHIIEFMTRLPGIIWDYLTQAFNNWVAWGRLLIDKVIEIGTGVVTWLITKLTEFVAWLPGFLLSIITAIINFGVDLVGRIIQIGVDFVAGLINAIINLPGQVAGILGEIISGLPGFAADMFTGAFNIGTSLVEGIIGGIGDLVGLVKDMVLSAINGVGDLGGLAYDKMKSVGSSMWNGFKSGLGISSPSYIEEAAFAMNENVAKAIDTLGNQVRSMQGLSRSIPSVDTGSSFSGSAALVGAGVLASTGQTSDSLTAVAPGLTVQGPLIGEAVISEKLDIVDVTRELIREIDRQYKSTGRKFDGF